MEGGGIIKALALAQLVAWIFLIIFAGEDIKKMSNREFTLRLSLAIYLISNFLVMIFSVNHPKYFIIFFLVSTFLLAIVANWEED